MHIGVYIHHMDLHMYIYIIIETSMIIYIHIYIYIRMYHNIVQLIRLASMSIQHRNCCIRMLAGQCKKHIASDCRKHA